MRASARELLLPLFTPLVWCGQGLNPPPLAPKVDSPPTELSEQYSGGVLGGVFHGQLYEKLYLSPKE